MAARRIFVPGDAAARSVGADAVADALQAAATASGQAVDIVRTGSRGLFWLEPLVEIDSPAGRIGYGPVTPAEAPALLAAPPDHAKRLGPVAEIPWLKRQQRLTFARCGIIDPLSLDDYRAQGGLRGLDRARGLSREAILDAVVASGLRGRGGAGFPAGIKWRTVAAAAGEVKYLVCNADEGDSGTFADRMLMEGDPFLLIEGLLIAGLATGAAKGFVYIRSEYPDAARMMRRAIGSARAAGLLGPDAFGRGKGFELDVRLGAGAYVCGEETALLESLEGRRGQVRAKPPLPAHAGLFGRPTLVNNVLTFAAVPTILGEGAQLYRDIGFGTSRGTMPIQLGGNVRRGGLIETGFGLPLRAIIEDFGGGCASGRPVRAVQVGGPLGAYWPETLFDTPFDYEAFAARGGLIGHGGVVLFDDSVDLARQARFAFEFCALESCGKCTPCRIGSVRGTELLDKIIAGEQAGDALALVRDLCEVLRDGSLCALGGLTPMPVLSALDHFPGDFAGGRPGPAGRAKA